jgi:hypothetical protein
MQIAFNETILSALQSAAVSANTSPEQLVIELVSKHVVKHEIEKTKAHLRDLQASGGTSTKGRAKAVLEVFEKQPQTSFRVDEVTEAVPGSNGQYNGRVLTELYRAGKIKRVGHGVYQLA